MKAELVDFMGDDLRVVNAARVSFAKESEWEFPITFLKGGIPYTHYEEPTLSEKDAKLIAYLAKHNHFTPFTHVVITMREKVPIFVARQRFKHTVGFSYNEVSRRYVDDAPEFFYPDKWRKAVENVKQGSSDEEVKEPIMEGPWDFPYQYDDILYVCKKYYETLIESGVAPEQARMVLPQSMYTSYYVTGSLAAWARAYKLRSDNHAQKEIQDLASQWNTIISNLPELKYSWQALVS